MNGNESRSSEFKLVVNVEKLENSLIFRKYIGDITFDGSDKKLQISTSLNGTHVIIEDTEESTIFSISARDFTNALIETGEIKLEEGE